MLGQLERAVDQRLGLVLFHPSNVDAGELQGGLRLVVLAARGTGLFERLLLELLGLREPSLPARHARTPVERGKAAFVVVRFDDRERLVRELRRARDLAVERRDRFRERGQSAGLQVARA